jgi:hypothetical protein
MRALILAAVALTTTFHLGVALPQAPSKAASLERYSTSTTDIGTLIDDPAAHAVVDRYLPGLLAENQINLARTMTLAAIQPFAADRISDKALADIDVELAKLPVKQ